MNVQSSNALNALPPKEVISATRQITKHIYLLSDQSAHPTHTILNVPKKERKTKTPRYCNLYSWHAKGRPPTKLWMVVVAATRKWLVELPNNLRSAQIHIPTMVEVQFCSGHQSLPVDIDADVSDPVSVVDGIT
jgi:hypothetical protein